MSDTIRASPLFRGLKDIDGAVELIIDQSVLDSPMLQCHPYTNTATLDIAVFDIKRLLRHYHREFRAVEL